MKKEGQYATAQKVPFKKESHIEAHLHFETTSTLYTVPKSKREYSVCEDVEVVVVVNFLNRLVLLVVSVSTQFLFHRNF